MGHPSRAKTAAERSIPVENSAVTSRLKAERDSNSCLTLRNLRHRVAGWKGDNHASHDHQCDRRSKNKGNRVGQAKPVNRKPIMAAK